MKRARKRHVQLALEEARRPDGKHGGWRPNAGRPRKAGVVSHERRAALRADHPQHVTLRVRQEVGSIARAWLMPIVHECVRRSHSATFRIVEFNVLGNHIHLITEAANEKALACGVQAFEVRVARNLNSALKRTGSLFAQRYHVRALRTPTEVRNALRYVLLNRKHHDREKKWSKTWFDPCSSAAWFDGWERPLASNAPWQTALPHMPKPTANAVTWLLRAGWKRAGLLRPDDTL